MGTGLLPREPEDGESLLNYLLVSQGQDSSLRQGPARFSHQVEGKVGLVPERDSGAGVRLAVGRQTTHYQRCPPLSIFFTSLIILLLHISFHPRLVN